MSLGNRPTRWRAANAGYAVLDNYNLTSHKYKCIITYQSDTKSNPNPNPNPI